MLKTIFQSRVLLALFGPSDCGTGLEIDKRTAKKRTGKYNAWELGRASALCVISSELCVQLLKVLQIASIRYFSQVSILFKAGIVGIEYFVSVSRIVPSLSCGFSFLQVFPGRKAIQWRIIRAVFSALYPVSHVTIVISLVSFFVTAFGFAINCALEMTFEMISPLGGESSSQTFYTFCMFALLCCTIVWVCVVCSLFWEIIKVAVVKRTLKFKVAKVVTLLIILISASIHASCVERNFGLMTFLSSCIIVSWFAACLLSVVGSAALFAFCYREQTHELYALVLLPMMVCFVLFSILSPVSFTLVRASTGAVCFSFFYPFLTACLILYICLRGCRKPSGEYFIIKKRFAFLFIIAYLGVLILAITSHPYCSNQDCYFPQNNHTQMNDFNLVNKEAIAPRYPICGNTWTPLRLSVADVAYLSYVAYLENWNRQHLNQTINSYFRGHGTKWNVSYISEENPRFYHVYESTKGIDIVGICGTKNTSEWIENLKLWSEIISYQVTSMALPVQQMPQNFMTSFVSAASFLERLLHHNHRDFTTASIESYLKEHVINRTTHHVLLTGHSMGGGLAKIIGSRLGLSAVSFSSPGESHIHAKMGFTLDDLRRHTTSVVSRSDMVTWVDHHGGLVQYIGCNASGYVQCHSIVNTYCELKTSCGFDTPIMC